MRQTSQAVLLLLSSVTAITDTPVIYATSLEAAQTAVNVLTQGTPLVIKQPIYQPLIVITAPALAIATSNVPAGTAGTTSCMDCIRGGTATATARSTVTSVWCSAAWNYEFKTGAAYKVLATSAYNKDSTSDAGSCCYLPTVMAELAAKTSADADASLEVNKLLNKWTCPAKFSNNWLSTKKLNLSVVITATPWWCSDGSYNMVANADYGTVGATATSYGARVETFATSYTPVIAVTDDRRFELFAASCRQQYDICQQSLIETSATASTMLRTLNVGAQGFSSSEKCSWYMESVTKAPTFSISNVTDGKELDNKYDVIFQEWVEGWQLTKLVDYVEKLKATATTPSASGVTFGHMAAASYTKAAKYNYAQNIVNGNWAAQTQPQAWYYDAPVAATPCTAPADITAGAANNCYDTTPATKSTVRWFDTKGASGGIKNAEATLATFNGLATTYNTKATSYNTYLADLKTANEKDAFSAFFSPPVKPKFVKRANAPTIPATYAGMQHWSTAKQQDLWNKKGSGIPAYNTDFIAGNQLGTGGWGAWTITRINGGYVKGTANPLWHSFGMLGVQQGPTATPLNTMSWVKGWQHNSEVPSTIMALYNSHTAASGFISCGNSGVQTTTSNLCPFLDNAHTGTQNIPVNTKKTYLTVSLWAADVTVKAAAAFDFDLTIQFYASDWATKGYYAPPAGTALIALTEPAAAQALAATAAAALAVAAALY